MAARPRTLPAAAAPVLVGTAYAATLGTFHPLRFVATLLGALLIQIGTTRPSGFRGAGRAGGAQPRRGRVRVTAGVSGPPKQRLHAPSTGFGVAGPVGVCRTVGAGWGRLAV